jgi:hypothetical protein
MRAGRRHRPDRHRVPPAARHQQVEQDRAPPVPPHLHELARPTPGKPRGRRPAHRRDNHPHRTTRPSRTRRGHLPQGHQDQRPADARTHPPGVCGGTACGKSCGKTGFPQLFPSNPCRRMSRGDGRGTRVQGPAVSAWVSRPPHQASGSPSFGGRHIPMVSGLWYGSLLVRCVRSGRPARPRPAAARGHRRRGRPRAPTHEPVPSSVLTRRRFRPALAWRRADASRERAGAAGR